MIVDILPLCKVRNCTSSVLALENSECRIGTVEPDCTIPLQIKGNANEQSHDVSATLLRIGIECDTFSYWSRLEYILNSEIFTDNYIALTRQDNPHDYCFFVSNASTDQKDCTVLLSIADPIILVNKSSVDILFSTDDSSIMHLRQSESRHCLLSGNGPEVDERVIKLGVTNGEHGISWAHPFRALHPPNDSPLMFQGLSDDIPALRMSSKQIGTTQTFLYLVTNDECPEWKFTNHTHESITLSHDGIEMLSLAPGTHAYRSWSIFGGISRKDLESVHNKTIIQVHIGRISDNYDKKWVELDISGFGTRKIDSYNVWIRAMVSGPTRLISFTDVEPDPLTSVKPASSGTATLSIEGTCESLRILLLDERKQPSQQEILSVFFGGISLEVMREADSDPRHCNALIDRVVLSISSIQIDNQITDKPHDFKVILFPQRLNPLKVRTRLRYASIKFAAEVPLIRAEIVADVRHDGFISIQKLSLKADTFVAQLEDDLYQTFTDLTNDYLASLTLLESVLNKSAKPLSGIEVAISEL